ncbi:ImcF-related family protein [Pseudomonas fluorescens]|uniref:ImcF-related family protein n=1 Tax=Pseudomonas fluorescens TaxID=294 RepID=UPI00178255DC|nr:ImcF-related family protein [Pseudomonas fluorescens]
MKKQISVWVVVLCLFVIGALLIWVDNPILSIKDQNQQLRLFVGLLAVCLLILLLDSLGMLGIRRLAALDFLSRVPKALASAPAESAAQKPGSTVVARHLREQYGLFWRRKVRVLLVVGEDEQINAIVPGLVEKHWLEGEQTVLLWGGTLKAKPEAALEPWRGLTRWRAFDGVVWALTQAQSADAKVMSHALNQLRNIARELRWHLPVHLWQVCDSAWSQGDRSTQPVGCLFSAGITGEQLEERLTVLLPSLCQGGMAQIQNKRGHDFLLRLSRDLQAEGIARWRQALQPLLAHPFRGLSLRGLWFSLPVAGGDQAGLENHWPADPAWRGVLGEQTANPRRLGWPPARIAYAAVLCLAMVWGAGLLLSFASNRVQLAQVQNSLTTLQQAAPGAEQRRALHQLVDELARLEYRAAHGAPWYQRFGLNPTEALHAALWPHYVQVNDQLLRDPAAATLQRQLNALVQLPADSPERATRATEAYAQLKAYLMLARPEKADPAFLLQTLGTTEPELWRFYAEHLAANPQWRIDADPTLVAQARQVLLGQLGQRNAQASLYQQVLDSAVNNYPALGLQQLVGETDALALFTSAQRVPGVFTRQAWEGQVRKAIDEVAEARREEIDWVLSDNASDIAAELAPEALRQQLTERYFQDYSSAWLSMLNSLRWQPAASLTEVIDQLTLMSDIRQSPLIALMNTLAYQGQAGSRGLALSDSLIKSAQNLLQQDKTPVIDQQAQGPGSPLDASFGPLLSLLGKGPQSSGSDDNLSLTAFLTRVTRVRLKLQQVSNAADPQAMTQALAQTVFQGHSVDLTETQAYGNLIAASLGAEWGTVGQTLFVQPLQQAWQRVLQPSAAGLNSQWQRAIVNPWQQAFDGRYPFALTGNDASLPMLGQMIRADSGRIDQFLQQQLRGVLRKEGNCWVADPQHSQGLRFNPQFLAAINQLSELADVLYTDGGMGLSFELRGKPVRDVVQTTFLLNGQRHEYFNQKEFWQRFSWPGFSDHPGARLTWTSVRTGERMFGDYQGTWGLIRLLEQARVTVLDDSATRYRIVLEAPDGLGLTWHLRTELGAGPLALLKLRSFRLPQQIFLAEGSQ